MILELLVLKEDVQTRDGKEYVTITGMETGPTPMLQMLDYGLRGEEVLHKGKLVGKSVRLQVESVRALFSGRPQMQGKLLAVNNAK